MKKRLTLGILSLTLLLAACSPAVATDSNSGMPMNNGNMQGVTATPGSMMAENPAASHMMEPITAPNVQPATESQGGQPLEFREENGVKVFELTAKAVKWNILDNVAVTA